MTSRFSKLLNTIPKAMRNTMEWSVETFVKDLQSVPDHSQMWWLLRPAGRGLQKSVPEQRNSMTAVSYGAVGAEEPPKSWKSIRKVR